MTPQSPPRVAVSSSPAGLSLDDPRLVAALEEYLAAVEAGQTPDRADFLARHADLDGALAQCLDGLNALQPPASSTTGPGGLAGPTLPAELPLGDFLIRRELGRGGMGIVYEAEQLSLGRRVALKVLPFASTLDPRKMQRFQNEARAAAGLQHPHIVPVYAVGCERGVHYYAMQYVEGQSLEELLDHLRQQGETALPISEASEHAGTGPADACPGGMFLADTVPALRASALTLPSLRQGRAYYHHVAELMAQAAEALEYAHQAGIVHRDVKPGNLLLDGQGKLWVTDFGLAQVQSDARLTLTGDLVGTLRYMSPEQALAKPGLVGHRSDIYALGATLYELLTLRPVFAGHDRQELLRQIAFEEVPLARVHDRAVPVDLETIAGRALLKEPAERYSTMQELADDLRRFLKDEPIRAKRQTLAQRLRKWTMRNHAIVLATAAALFIGLMVSTWQAIRATLAESQATMRESESRAVRLRAEANLQLALELAKSLRPTLKEPRLSSGKTPLDDYDLITLRRAAAVWKQVAADYPDHTEYVMELAKVHSTLGELLLKYEHAKESVAAFQDAITAFETLPQDAVDRRLLGKNYNYLGDAWRMAGNFPEAEKAYLEARTLHPTFLRPLNNKLGALYRAWGKPAQSRDFFASGTGASPRFVAVADLDCDGRLDLVTANAGSDSLQVLLGNGDGTFRLGQCLHLPAATEPNQVLAVDLSGDGKLDLAVVETDADAVSVWLGKGDGTFTAGPRSPAGSSPRALAAGDFNADGILDLAVAQFAGVRVIVLLGKGDGTFRPPVEFPAWAGGVAVAVADANGDGKLDLAVANHSGSITFLYGKGDGTFDRPTYLTLRGQPMAVVWSDLNGDGKLDLAAANCAVVSVFLGNGDGTFQREQTFAAGAHPLALAAGDLNADGRPDLAVCNFAGNNVSLLLGRGDGTFEPPSHFATGSQPYAVVVLDLNGDGKNDVVVTNAESNTLTVLMNEGQGRFSSREIAVPLTVPPLSTQ